MKSILNIDSLEYRDFGRGDKFEAKLGQISLALGAQKLGYNLTVVPPGKRAFPLHNHRTNEEMFFIVEGTGTLRVGKEAYPIRRGDVIACPPGDPETAHQIVNTSNAELKYLSVSTMISPEMCEYPESGKIGLYHHLPPAPDGTPQRLRYFAKEQGTMDDYWDGEA